MAKSKIPFKTSLNQPIGTAESKRIQRKRRVARRLDAKRRQIHATKVNNPQERIHRIKWMLKWVLFFPLSLFVLMWVLVILMEVFKY